MVVNDRLIDNKHLVIHQYCLKIQFNISSRNVSFRVQEYEGQSQKKVRQPEQKEVQQLLEVLANEPLVVNLAAVTV